MVSPGSADCLFHAVAELPSEDEGYACNPSAAEGHAGCFCILPDSTIRPAPGVIPKHTAGSVASIILAVFLISQHQLLAYIHTTPAQHYAGDTTLLQGCRLSLHATTQRGDVAVQGGGKQDQINKLQSLAAEMDLKASVSVIL